MCQSRKGGDIVDNTVREVWGAADEEDGIWIYKSRDGGCVDFVGGGRARDEVDFYLKVFACFEESGVGGIRDNSITNISNLFSSQQEERHTSQVQ